MAIDPHPSPEAIESFGPRINDDIPAYRALNPLSVVSLIFGLASILTFTSPYFVGLGILAIVFGLLAQRKIARFPDILTGTGIARAGIGFGLLFSLSALTVMGVNELITRIEANRFARSMTSTLQSGGVADILYLKASPGSRKGKTPDEIAEEMEHGAMNAQMWEMDVKPIKDLKARLKSSPDQALTFTNVSDYSTDGMSVFATARYDVKGTPTAAFPQPEQILRLRVRGTPVDGKYAWGVEDVRFPDK